jgi:hypothetical protein
MKARCSSCSFAAFAQAGAQSGVLVSSLPADYETPGHARGRRQGPRRARLDADAERSDTTLDARKDNSRMRVFVRGRRCASADQSVRDRGQKQREHRREGPHLTAVPQAEIDALRADLESAFAGTLPLAGVVVPTIPGQVLLVVPAALTR